MEQPSPTYSDPAPLGGSFIVDCLKGSAPLNTNQLVIPTREEVEAARASLMKVPDRQRREEMRMTLRSVCRELLDLIETSLGSDSGEAWEDFWSEHIREYITLFETIQKFSRRLGAPRGKQVTMLDDFAARFPDAAEELDFVINLVDSACQQAQDFGPVSEEHRDKDFAIAGRYDYWGAHFNMCMLTLDLCASNMVRIERPILDQVFVTARQAALEFNHAVMEASALRETDAVQSAEDVGEAISIDDDLESAEAAIARFEGRA